ncbi:MAG: sensor histidine kinase [Acidobacteria bacterium]|nr:sensor histidine kinase [Acidobacteriota bacterium]
MIRLFHYLSGKSLRKEVRISTHISLLAKLVISNAFVIILVAVGGVWSARYIRGVPAIIMMLFLGSAGCAISAIAVYLIMKNYFQPLIEFRKAVESIHGGITPSIVARSDSDPAIGGVIRSVRDAIDRLEDESLWHTTRLLNSIEAERQRIGRELHDQTSQTLATALINLKLADSAIGAYSPDARKKLAAAKHLIEHSLEQIKICVYDLRPVMLDDLGLVPTLRWHIKTHLAGTGLAIEADFEDANLRAPLDIETTLYRIAQEALSNVTRHAHATRVAIRLEIKPEYAALLISDNGQGFDPDSEIIGKRSSGGLGLHTIRERVKLAKGTLNIKSAKSMGTQINVVVPIAPQNSMTNEGEPYDKGAAR